MAGIGERVGPFKLTARLEVDEGLELWEGVRADETLKKPSEVWIRLLTSEDPKEARRLRREYEALRSIDDPRVPMVVGFFAGQGSLAMTPLAGVSLRLVLRAAIEELVVLDVATAFDIVLDVAYALRAAHSILGTSERFVHGALSPEMVLVGPEGSVGVSGIGAGLHCPPHYRAPECLEGPPTRSSDQWQIGALLFELLTLRPFIHPLPMEHLRKDPGESLEALDPGDRRLLQRMLATDPKRRFHADREVLKALHQRAREVGGTSHRDQIFDHVVVRREQLDGAAPPQTPEEVEESDNEISVSKRIQTALEVQVNDASEPLLGSRAHAASSELLSDDTEEQEEPQRPRLPPLPASAPPVSRKPWLMLGEWMVLLLFFLFVVAALWYVTMQVV